MSSDISGAFDAPWIEPVDGFGDVAFARAEMDYWSAWAEKIKLGLIEADRKRLSKLPVLDPVKRMDIESRIENQKVYLGAVLDLQNTPDGLKKILEDSIVVCGKSLEDAKKILKRIGPGRQIQLGQIVCSEPQPTIDEYRMAVREQCIKRGMPSLQVNAMSDGELVRMARELALTLKPEIEKEEGGSDSFSEGGATSTPEPTGI